MGVLPGLFGPLDAGLAVLEVLDGQLQGVRAQVGAVQLVFRQPLQGLGHVLVGDFLGLGQGLAHGDLREHAGHRDGRSAAEGLELDVLDAVFRDLQIDGHHVPAQRVADLADAVCLFDDTDVAGVSEMIHHRFVVHGAILLRKKSSGPAGR